MPVPPRQVRSGGAASAAAACTPQLYSKTEARPPPRPAKCRFGVTKLPLVEGLRIAPPGPRRGTTGAGVVISSGGNFAGRRAVARRGEIRWRGSELMVGAGLTGERVGARGPDPGRKAHA